jgi:hypothetical protein
MKIIHGRSFILILLILLFTLPAAAGENGGLSQSDILQQSFIENKGQWPGEVKFAALLPGMNAWITDDGVVYDYFNREGDRIKGHVVRMNLLNSKTPAREGIRKKEEYYNFYLGDDPSKWASEVGAYASVGLNEVYDNIDMKMYFDQDGMRYDMIVWPGGDPSEIRMDFEGAEISKIDHRGELVFKTSVGEVSHSKLFAYQRDDNGINKVECRFDLKADGSVGFIPGDYDRGKPLIIDPIVYSTFLGGMGSDYVNSIAIDISGNSLFITGETMSIDYTTTTGAYDEHYNGAGDVFLSKMNSNGTALIFSTFLGSIHEDVAMDLEIDARGNIYVTGFTKSTDFPTTTDAYSESHNGGVYDAFVAKFDDRCSALLFSTFIGGSGEEGKSDPAVGEKLMSITVDPSNNPYVAGFTSSSDFPTTGSAYDRVKNGDYDIYVIKLSSNGQNLRYSTLLGGNESSGLEFPCGIDYISGDEVVVAGSSNASDFPTTSGAYDETPNGGVDVFLAKFDDDASDLIYSTMYGGSSDDIGHGMKSDPVGYIHIVGTTLSSVLPTSTNGYDKVFNASGENDGFLVRISSDGSSLIYGSYLGGEGEDVCQDITTDNSGSSYITGYTGSTLFPTTAGAFYPNFNGGVNDAFFSIISSSGLNLSYSTYFGGSSIDQGLGVRHNGSSIFVAGYTKSSNYPVTAGVMDPLYSGQSDMFITRFTVTLPRSVTITAPDDNETLDIGSTYRIEWASENINNIKLEYETPTQRNTIVASYDASARAYDWTVPSISGEFSIVITDVDDASVTDQVDGLRSTYLELTGPAASSQYYYGESASITWNSTNINSVNLDYSVSGSQQWTSVSSNTISAASGSYVWPVPDMTNNITLRISDAADATTQSTVDIMLNNHSLTLTQPNGGEKIMIGAEYPIRWQNVNVSTAKLEYKAESATDWTEIASGVNAAGEEYQWNTSSITEGLYRIKITDEDYPAITDRSDNTFSLVDASLDLTSPDGGEIWQSGESRQLTWTSRNIDYIDIYYSTNAGDSWTAIATDFPAHLQNYYNWTVPGNPSGEYLVKIEASDIYGAVDISSAVFQVQGVDLLSPDGGGKYLVGSNHNITWNSAGVENLKIMYSTNSGTTWNTIDESYPASAGFYAWTIPSNPSSQCKVKLMDTQNSGFNDESQSEFVVTGIMLTAPSGGEEWYAGTTQQITWTSASTDNIKIEYSTDGGDSWVTIISNTPASNGSYDWIVPKVSSDECLIRISDVSDTGVYDTNSQYFSITGEGIIINSPDGDVVWDKQTVHDIEWISINIVNVDIEYSVDNSNSWTTIAEGVNASDGRYSWTLPNESSTECLVRISDSDNPSVSATSAVFRIKGGVYRVPSSWEHTTRTGSSAVIIVPDSSDPLVGTRDFLTGDAIGLFYTRDGQLVCGGYGVWTEDENLAITVWGDNGRTSLKDGFATGEDYTFKVWDGQLGREIMAYVEYESGPDNFTKDGISVLSLLETHRTLDINLPGGVWSYISSNLLPVDSNLVRIMAGVEISMDLMKNDLGEVYYPDENVNNIEFWDITEGYQIYMKETDVLTITGLTIDPSNYPIRMSPSLWYIVSYLPSAPIRTETALASLGNNLLLAKNSDGEVYYPRYDIDQIHNMNPTEGYKMILVSSATLTYPSATTTRTKRKHTPDKIAKNEGSYRYTPDVRGTGSNAVLIVESDQLSVGDEIGVFTESGILAGGGIFEKGRAVVTIWGDNQSTPATEGARSGEQLLIRCWRAAKAEERDFSIERLTNMLSGVNDSKRLIYERDAIWLAEGAPGSIISVLNAEINEFDIDISPNPSAGRFALRFASERECNARITLHNSYGRKVYGWEIHAAKGYNKMDLNIKHVPSGAYYLRLEICGGTATERVIIIK